MSTPDDDADFTTSDDTAVQPLRDTDGSIEPDPTLDPAQAEWDRTTEFDEVADPADLDPATQTGADPDELPGDDDQIPASDLPTDDMQPDTQGDDPVEAELGEDGQGDLSPEDL